MLCQIGEAGLWREVVEGNVDVVLWARLWNVVSTKHRSGNFSLLTLQGKYNGFWIRADLMKILLVFKKIYIYNEGS